MYFEFDHRISWITSGLAKASAIKHRAGPGVLSAGMSNNALYAWIFESKPYEFTHDLRCISFPPPLRQHRITDLDHTCGVRGPEKSGGSNNRPDTRFILCKGVPSIPADDASSSGTQPLKEESLRRLIVFPRRPSLRHPGVQQRPQRCGGLKFGPYMLDRSRDEEEPFRKPIRSDQEQLQDASFDGEGGFLHLTRSYYAPVWY
jgi:hypothetical protein